MKVVTVVSILLLGAATSAYAQAASADEGRRVWGYVFAAPAIGGAPTSEQFFHWGGGVQWRFRPRVGLAADMTTFGTAPRWGSEWKAFIKRNADRWNTAYLQKTTLPYEDNYLDLDPTIKDPLGFPVCRITADYKDNERKVAAFIQDKMAEWFMMKRMLGFPVVCASAGDIAPRATMNEVAKRTRRINRI